MTDTDILAFLKARLDEDEAWARGASLPYRWADAGSKAPDGGVHWRWVAGDDWGTVDIDPALNEFVTEPGYSCWLATVETWSTGLIHRHEMPRAYANSIVEMDSAAAGHIARHDPSRVLREVAAKRQIVAEYGRAIDRRREHRDDLASAGALLIMVRILKLTASIYSDHPSWSTDG